MPRTRQLKPDFFHDEDVASLDPLTQLLFQGLWLLADRRGRLEDRPLKIRAAVFPYRADADVDRLLAELATPKKHGLGALITRYDGPDGRRYIQVNNFEKHQRPHPKEPESTIPPIDKDAGKRLVEPRKATATPDPAVYVRPESVPSCPSGSASSCAGEEPPSAVPGGEPGPRALPVPVGPHDVSPNVDGPGKMAKRAYCDTAWKVYCERRGNELPGPTPTEWAVLERWYDQGIPIRAIHTGMSETKGTGRNRLMNYYGPSVEAEAARMRQAAGFGAAAPLPP